MLTDSDLVGVDRTFSKFHLSHVLGFAKLLLTKLAVEILRGLLSLSPFGCLVLLLHNLNKMEVVLCIGLHLLR